MSKKYRDPFELLDAVKSFVNQQNQIENTFKIDVYVGRGVHTFELHNEESLAVANVASLKKQLKDAKAKLNETRKQSEPKKRKRTAGKYKDDSSFGEQDLLDEDWPASHNSTCDFTPPSSQE